MAIGNIQELYASLNAVESYTPIIMKQYDKNTRTIEIVLLDSGGIYEIPSGTVAKLHGTKPNGTPLLEDCTIVGNTIKYTATEEFTAFVGEIQCEVGLYEPDVGGDTTKDKLLQSATFPVTIDKSVLDRGAIEGSYQYQTLTVIINTLNGLIQHTVGINDTYTSLNETWSSNKINSELVTKLDKTGDGSNNTENFVSESSLVNINSGEKHLTIFGKIMKLFTDYMAHKANITNPHSTTASQVNLGNVTNESKTTMFSSPTFTGTPVSTTPTSTDSSTKIATTAFVKNTTGTLTSLTTTTKTNLVAAISEVNNNLALSYGTLLYTNPSTTSPFAGTTIVIGAQYKRVKIYYRCATDSDTHKSEEFIDGTKVLLENMTGFLRRFRDIYMGGGSLVISNGATQQVYAGATTTNNTVCIPYKIYGYTS